MRAWKTGGKLAAPEKLKQELERLIQKGPNFIKIILGPEKDSVDGKPALYTIVKAKGGGDEFFPFIKQGEWSFFNIQFKDRGYMVNVNGFCKSPCENSDYYYLISILKSVTFF